MAFNSYTALLAPVSNVRRRPIFPRSACVVSVAFSHPVGGAFLVALGILLIITGAIAILK
jgi:hypothetical protein